MASKGRGIDEKMLNIEFETSEDVEVRLF